MADRDSDDPEHNKRDEWKEKQKELAKKLRREAYQKKKAYAAELKAKAKADEKARARGDRASADVAPEDAELQAQKERAKEHARAQRKAAYQKAKEAQKAEQARAKAEARQQRLRDKEERDRNNPLFQQLQELKLQKQAELLAKQALEKHEREHGVPDESDDPADSAREQLLSEAVRRTLN